MKKYLALLLCLSMVLSLAACSFSLEKKKETDVDGNGTASDADGSEKDPSENKGEKDLTPPQITAPESVLVMVGEEIDLLSHASALDEDGAVCAVSVEGSFDLSRAGEYSLSFVSSDGAGNTAKKDFVLKVLALPFDENGKLVEGSYTTKNGFPLVVKDGIAYVDGHLLVNKSYSLPKAYKLGDRTLTAETQKAYNELRSAAAAAGFPLTVKSATRDWNDQSWIFSGYVKNDGVEEAETYSARPGHSEHQSGMAMDLVTSSSEEAASEKYKPILDWLNENAYRYGFILRYPEGKTAETGYIFENWHYRYVGTELAEILYNNGDWITMEAYFGVDSVYRGYR